jgi:Mg2+ and Co2+ transporter CorA
MKPPTTKSSDTLTCRNQIQLFQLRSIEQNEIAIRTDFLNKSILLFTGVTIVFLPLNFFTSYYGMNIKGLVDTRDVGFFWKVCGTIAFLIIFFVTLYAFRRRIRETLATPRRPRPEDPLLTYEPSELIG